MEVNFGNFVWKCTSFIAIYFSISIILQYVFQYLLYCNMSFSIYYIAICLSVFIILQYVLQYLSYCNVSFNIYHIAMCPSISIILQYVLRPSLYPQHILIISSIYLFCYSPSQSRILMINEIWGTQWITGKGRDFPANPKLPPHCADSGIVSAISPHPTDFCRLFFRFFGPSQGEILF